MMGAKGIFAPMIPTNCYALYVLAILKYDFWNLVLCYDIFKEGYGVRGSEM